LVPGAVLVGGTVSALYADHRTSLDHDHVLTDLADRFDAVLEALRADPAFLVARIVPGKLILGSLDGIEVGVRQQRRARSLETQQVDLPSGRTLTVPTLPEALRIKAFLLTDRNRAKDYLDVAALATHIGLEEVAKILDDIDQVYPTGADPIDPFDTTWMRLRDRLANPAPVDVQPSRHWAALRALTPPWNTWATVVSACGDLAAAMKIYRAGRLALNPAADLARWLRNELTADPPDVAFMLRVMSHETQRWHRNEQTAAEMPELVAEIPPSTGSDQWDALLGGVVAFRLWEMSIPEPDWCDNVWLDEPWWPYKEVFPGWDDDMAVAAARNTPPQILCRGVIWSAEDLYNI